MSSLLSLASQVPYYNLTISHGSISHVITLNESYYIFTGPEHTLPPCEVYNFSIIATYVGVTYTGAGCSIPSSETLMLYLRNLLGTDNFWTEVNLLGELILNTTVEV